MTDVLERLRAALADRYAIEREIGSGGMATVYLAEDLKHRRKVAIKVLRPELSATLGPERFVREIEIAANLTHPHILPLHDSGEADGFLYYVMPFIDGESLRERIDREGKLDVREALRLTDQVTSALSHAHERALVHRDIKPENILLAGDQAIVADFGIARAVEVAGGERLTGTGLAVGTPAYMSPEQAVGDNGWRGPSRSATPICRTSASDLTSTLCAPTRASRRCYSEWGCRSSVRDSIARCRPERVLPAVLPTLVAGGVPRIRNPLTVSGGPSGRGSRADVLRMCLERTSFSLALRGSVRTG